MSLVNAAHSQTQEAVIHHAANAAAVAFPAVAAAYQLPWWIVLPTAVAGLTWYCILIAEKIALWQTQWRQTRESAQRVAVVLQGGRHGNETSSD